VPVAFGDQLHTTGLDRNDTIAVHPFANGNLRLSLNRLEEANLVYWKIATAGCLLPTLQLTKCPPTDDASGAGKRWSKGDIDLNPEEAFPFD
jgi:hypothetical protein